MATNMLSKMRMAGINPGMPKDRIHNRGSSTCASNCREHSDAHAATMRRKSKQGQTAAWRH